ncbi:hypothetical protein LXA43DRAFT_1025068 [Ganoderma leucocontextum]|nr:hypothetical protein LXA43DRAFT_1042135 [Ganoderma leucocontextum]KAI1785269.1 hypothetical protein LXA43DRAFT_1038805 [Ganoderma leucocontextum]KAI1788524.1 hypothetical protein LXA43DRAFT_1025068 [Ganoderma leucocontextum]
MSSPPPATKSKFAPYKQALAALSQRTRTPLPSLIISFGILHELTAIVPLAGFFFAARGFGVGEGVVGALAPRPGTEGETGLAAQVRESWVGERFREWMVEGEARAERAGRRYGWFGYEKGSKPPTLSPDEQAERHAEAVLTGKIAGDVANAVVAYALTKALLPVRIGLSMYLAPPFSRTFIQPVASVVSRVFRRKST